MVSCSYEPKGEHLNSQVAAINGSQWFGQILRTEGPSVQYEWVNAQHKLWNTFLTNENMKQSYWGTNQDTYHEPFLKPLEVPHNQFLMFPRIPKKSFFFDQQQLRDANNFNPLTLKSNKQRFVVGEIDGLMSTP